MDNKIKFMPLEHPLNEEERMDRATQLAKVGQHLCELAEEKKRFNEEHKRKVSEQEEKELLLRHAVLTGKEVRSTEVREVVDESRWVLKVIREDTGEQVSERSMTSAEIANYRQGDMFEGAPKKGVGRELKN